MTTSPACESGLATATFEHRLWVGIGLAVVLAGLCIGWLLLPLGEWADALQRWIVGLGWPGAAMFALVFVAATLALAPDWPLAILAGWMFGVWALPLVLVAAILAASLAFLAARYLVRDRVRRALFKRPRFAAVDQAVAEEGGKIVILLRLSPLVPFNLQNYLFGATAIPFPHYLAATGAGIIPGTALYVYLGALGRAAESSGMPLKLALFSVGLLATAAVAALIARKARKLVAEVGLDDTKR
jgi:uncharacterized membrane protein YdjX (TVP38/TMEM64 family)